MVELSKRGGEVSKEEKGSLLGSRWVSESGLRFPSVSTSNKK